MHIIFNNTNIDQSLYTKKIYKKDEIIFEDGKECDHVGFLESGSISIVTNTYDENEYEINRIEKDGFFGTYLLFSNNPFYLGTAYATKQSTVIYFNKNNLLKALTNQTFLLNYLTLTSSSSINLQNKVKVLSQKSIKEKILFIIYQNYHNNNSLTYHFNSKEQLANYINVTRPSLSRTLIVLQDEGIITFDRHTISLKNSLH